MNAQLKNELAAALCAEPHSLRHFAIEIIQKLEPVFDDHRPALPVVGTYGNYSGDNYGAHTLKVQVNGLVLFYSYRSIVAYQDWKDGLVVSVNRWGTTTGKHLNWIQADHKKRVSNFDERLAAALERHGLRE